MINKALPTFDDLLSSANVMVDRSGRTILPNFRKALDVENKAAPIESVPGMGSKGTDSADKSYFDPVTIADRDGEKVIREVIEREWPDHGICGEEFADVDGSGRYKWVIDPIDGTRAFILGYPTWGTLLGLLDGDQPVLGIMDQPFTCERFWSSSDASYARTRDEQVRQLKTRDCASLSDAVLATTDPALFAKGKEEDSFNAVKARVAMTRYGADCYAYAMLASGFVDVIVEAGLKPFDIVALIPIVERAGGIVTTWDGGTAIHGGRILATGNKRLHEAAMELLA